MVAKHAVLESSLCSLEFPAHTAPMNVVTLAGKSYDPTARACARCGNAFTSTSSTARYCSNRCRQAAARQRRHKGLRCWTAELPDHASEEIVTALIHYGALTESSDRNQVAAEIGALGRRLLMWWAQHWRELEASDSRIP
jgi:hypothetical protein